MDISFDEFTEQVYIRLQREWNELAAEGNDPFAMNHYDLAIMTGEEAQDWKEFLMDGRVSKWLDDETELRKQQKIRQIIAGLDANSKSPGTAQTLSALQNSSKKANEKDGPTFVYCYIPLSVEEKKADNVKQLKKDPFLVGEEEDIPTKKESVSDSLEMTNSEDFL